MDTFAKIGIIFSALQFVLFTIIGLRVRSGTFYEINLFEDLIVLLLALLSIVVSVIFVCIGTIRTWKKKGRIDYSVSLGSVAISLIAIAAFGRLAQNRAAFFYLWRVPAVMASAYLLTIAVLVILQRKKKRWHE
jgi:hypothetical protein